MFQYFARIGASIAGREEGEYCGGRAAMRDA